MAKHNKPYYGLLWLLMAYSVPPQNAQFKSAGAQQGKAQQGKAQQGKAQQGKAQQGKAQLRCQQGTPTWTPFGHIERCLIHNLA
jgi:hypothetical protein